MPNHSYKYLGKPSPVRKVLDALESHGCDPKQEGNSWKALCPAHADKRPSLSIGEGDDGKALLKCHAGCDTKTILQKLGLNMPDLFLVSLAKKIRLVVADLARDKALLENFLNTLDVKNFYNQVKITYHLEDGSENCRQRRRTALKASEGGSSWYGSKANGDIVPYGLDRLSDARKTGVLILVEGESDCWTLWYHDFHAIGIPGSNMCRVLKGEYLREIHTLYISQESDEAGSRFVRSLQLQLRKIGFQGDVKLLPILPGGGKDINDYYKQDVSCFKANFEKIMKQAGPIPPIPFDPNIEMLLLTDRLKLKPTELKFYLGLYRIQTMRGIAPGSFFKASYKEIKNHTGMSSDTSIRKAWEKLGAKECIEVKSKGRDIKNRIPNEYRLVYPLPEISKFHTKNGVRKGKKILSKTLKTTPEMERKKAKNLPILPDFHSKNEDNVLRKKKKKR